MENETIKDLETIDLSYELIDFAFFKNNLLE